MSTKHDRRTCTTVRSETADERQRTWTTANGPGTDNSTADNSTTDDPTDVSRRARLMARKVSEGYRCHDERDREGAVDAFAYVDERQFAHLSAERARQAAAALVDALWAKDAVEASYVSGGTVTNPEKLAQADWEAVEEPLRRRARIVGMDPAYATETTTAWKRHKVGGDYTTPTLRAQRREVEAALGVDEYPRKPRAGGSGFGELPARYLVAVELHDERTAEAHERTVDVMEPYFETILSARSEN